MAKYGKGDYGKATKLHSKIVRERAGQCERCGSTDNLQCAHIISRTRSNTRTDLDNAWCLCAKCHWRLDHYHIEFALFFLEQNDDSFDNYWLLLYKAEEKPHMDWTAELERLQAIWDSEFG